jgi:hypothetical protein
MPQNLLDPNRPAPLEEPTEYVENMPGHVGQYGITYADPPPDLPGEEEGVPWQVHGPFDHLGRPPEHPGLPEYEEPGLPPPEATAPPEVVDAPYANLNGLELNCTMGNWTNEPTAYDYQWMGDGEEVSTNNPYTITPDDFNKTFICVLTVSNAAGSATSESNSVLIIDPAARNG